MKINKPCKGRIYAKAESSPWKWWNLRKRHHLVAVTENQTEGFGKTPLLERKSFYLSCRWQSLLGAEGPQKTCLSWTRITPPHRCLADSLWGRTWTSVVAAHGLQTGLTSCGSCAWWPCDVWDLPRLGISPLSPALPGRFLTHWTTREAPDISNYKVLFSTAVFFHVKDNPLQRDGNSTLFIREYMHMVSHAR